MLSQPCDSLMPFLPLGQDISSDINPCLWEHLMTVLYHYMPQPPDCTPALCFPAICRRAYLVVEAAILHERNTGSLVLNEEKALYLDIIRIQHQKCVINICCHEKQKGSLPCFHTFAVGNFYTSKQSCTQLYHESIFPPKVFFSLKNACSNPEGKL